jgi:hypothetical protein
VITGSYGKEYAATRLGPYTILMHRLVLPTAPNYEPDHIDGDGLNNQSSNLRPVTRQQNSANSKPKNGNKYKGTYYDKRRGHWVAQIHKGEDYYYLGSYATQEEAARAFDRKAYELNGPYAYINFPDDLTEWLKDQPPELVEKWSVRPKAKNDI